MTVAITRTELDAASLRAAAGRSKNASATRRMLVLALVMEGHSRSDGAHCWHGPADAARLGASLQRERLEGLQNALAWRAAAQAHA